MNRKISILMAGLLIFVGLMGCSPDKPVENSNTPPQEASAPPQEANAEDQETQEFKQLSPFTLSCSGDYVLTYEGKTNTGVQSFGITFDPPQFKAHYFGFYAEGSFNTGQRKINNEVLSINSVNSDWINLGHGYTFNRRTLKYDYENGLAAGTCKIIETRDIPDRRI